MAFAAALSAFSSALIFASAALFASDAVTSRARRAAFVIEPMTPASDVSTDAPTRIWMAGILVSDYGAAATVSASAGYALRTARQWRRRRRARIASE